MDFDKLKELFMEHPLRNGLVVFVLLVTIGVFFV